jgi:hypothetical protein
MFDLSIAALIGVPFGFLAGYLWRDRISRVRRARYRAEQERYGAVQEMRRAIAMENEG